MNSKSLWTAILVVAVLLIGLVGWWTTHRTRQEIQQIVQPDVDSSKVWQARVDSIARISDSLDRVLRQDSVDDALRERRRQHVVDSLAKARQHLQQALTTVDSLQHAVEVIAFQDNLLKADSVTERLLRNRLVLLQGDRAKWRSTAERLLAENRRITADLQKVAEIATGRCTYLIVRGPCPVLTPGLGATINPSGHVVAGLSATVGFPITLRKRTHPSAPHQESDLPVVSPTEIAP